MLSTVAIWVLCFTAGIVAQRLVRDPQRLSALLFKIALWSTVPTVVFFAYTTVELKRELLYTLGIVVVCSWLVVGIGFAWARLGGGDRRTRGTLALGTALGNTANVGYPIASLLFGSKGLALAVIYSELQFAIPTLAVAMGIARRFAEPQRPTTKKRSGIWRTLRSWLANPPVVAGAAAIVLRAGGVDLHGVVAPVGPYAGLAFGVLGFLQLGAALPLDRVRHTATELRLAGITIFLRCAAAPLLLFTAGRLAGVAIPPVHLLLAGMPVAFNTLIVARVFDLDTKLARLLILVSTPLIIGGILLWRALF